MIEESFLIRFYERLQSYTDILNEWYKECSVRKGLRNEDGTGMWIGLTRVAGIVGYEEVDGGIEAIPGRLLYRGVDILDLVEGKKGSHFGYEETCFLLLFEHLPKKTELKRFCGVVRHCYAIPDDFVEMNLLRFPNKNLTSRLQDAVLILYNYDNDPDNTDVYQTLVRGVNLLARLPSIACYAYQSRVHYYDRESLLIYCTNPEYSIAKNLLSLLRKGQKFTSKEANLLDTILVFHADHGGGSNSAFANMMITSTGTGVYSTVCDGIGSLKEPRHGGASIKVAEMMDAVLAGTGGYGADDKKIRQSVGKLMAGKLCGRSSLAYGFGRAVYTVSDPCAEVLETCCMGVAKGQRRTRELDFYIRFERIAKGIMEEIKGKTLPTNVDFHSGFAYGMLRIPRDLYTPLLVCSRIVGWVIHNIENKPYSDCIIRPATRHVGNNMDYVPTPER